MFNKKVEKAQTTIASVYGSLKTAMDAAGTTVKDPNLTAAMLSGESFEEAGVKTTVTGIGALFVDSGLKTLLAERFGGGDANHPMVDSAMNRAGLTMAAAGDVSSYQSAYALDPLASEKGVKILTERVPGIDIENLSGEGFDEVSMKDNLLISVMVSALSTSVNSFEQTFYPTVILAAGKGGVDIRVRTPYAYQLKARKADGSRYDAKEDRRSLTQAIRDNSILKSLANKVIPHATAAAASNLADPAILPNRSENISGISFDTRPLAFNKSIDLLAISAVAGLAGAGVQDQKDTLSTNAALGSIQIALTDSTASPVTEAVSVDVTMLPGSNFTEAAEGSATDQTLTFSNVLHVSMTDTTYTGASSLTVDVGTPSGIAGDWTLAIEVKITGSLDEDGNMEVFLNRISIIAAYDANGQAVGQSALDEVIDKITVSGAGWLPNAFRSNSNLRDRGLIIDAGTPTTYRIPVFPGAPLTAISPVNTSPEITIHELAKANRVRNANNAYLTLAEFHKVISRTTNLPANSTTVGSTLVEPTYAYSKLDVKKDLKIHSSMNGYADLRVGVTNALSLMADRLVVKSGYLAALELESGSSSNYEVIIVTDPQIAGLIMTSGDARTLGAGKDFVVSTCHDTEMVGKIFMSFRRTDVTGPNPLSHGFHAEMPAIVYNAQISMDKSTHQELQMIPRSRHAVTLPVLGFMELLNLETLFTTV